MKIAKIVVIAGALLLFQEPAASQNVAPDFLNIFLSLTDANCAVFIPEMLKNKDFEILKDNPIDVGEVCACSRKLIISDGRLVEKFSNGGEAMTKNVNFPNFKSYLGIRAVQSSLHCLSEALDKSISKVPLE